MPENVHLWFHYMNSMIQDTLRSLCWTSKCIFQKGFPNGDRMPINPTTIIELKEGQEKLKEAK